MPLIVEFELQTNVDSADLIGAWVTPPGQGSSCLPFDFGTQLVGDVGSHKVDMS